MKKFTLQVDGREMTFSEEELITIVKKHISNENFKKGPTEGEWFEVNPLTIDPKLFQEEREDESQERTRQIILKAFVILKRSPTVYGRRFYTMIPKKESEYETVADLKTDAKKMGSQMANWVHQALEWAQRIQNGNTWEEICNNADKSNWYRAVMWTDYFVRLVGGSSKTNKNYSASNVSGFYYLDCDKVNNVVPLIMRYDEDNIVK